MSRQHPTEEELHTFVEELKDQEPQWPEEDNDGEAQ